MKLNQLQGDVTKKSIKSTYSINRRRGTKK